jgi:7-cyano-7-deazaguanine synthase
MSEFDSVLLASGGMDSTTLAYKLFREGKRVIPLFLDYGQHCREKEFETLKEVLPANYTPDIKVIKIGDVYKESNSRMIKEANLWVDNVVADDLYLPYRNLLFLTIAAAFAQSKGIQVIYSAFINSNHAKEIDCSLEFFNKLEALLSDYGSVKIQMPFRDLTKSEVAKIGVELGAPIGKTYSCQINSNNHCGVCPNCVDRLKALNSLFEKVQN